VRRPLQNKASIYVDQSFLLKMISQHLTKETMCVSCARSPAVVARGGYTPVFTHTTHGELRLHSSSQPDSRLGHESREHSSVSHGFLKFLPVRCGVIKYRCKVPFISGHPRIAVCFYAQNFDLGHRCFLF